MILARLLSVGILTFYNKTWCVRKAMGGEEGSGHAAGRKEAKVEQLWVFFFLLLYYSEKKLGEKMVGTSAYLKSGKHGRAKGQRYKIFMKTLWSSPLCNVASRDAT